MTRCLSAKILKKDEANVSYICSRYYRSPELIFESTNYNTMIGINPFLIIAMKFVVETLGLLVASSLNAIWARRCSKAAPLSTNSWKLSKY